MVMSRDLRNLLAENPKICNKNCEESKNLCKFAKHEGNCNKLRKIKIMFFQKINKLLIKFQKFVKKMTVNMIIFKEVHVFLH